MNLLLIIATKSDSMENTKTKDKFEIFLDRYFEKTFFKIRFVALIAAVSSSVAAISLFILGAYEIITPILTFPSHHNISRVEIDIIKSVDLFLFGLVMLIFSMGVYELFVSELEPAKIDGTRPNWMRFESIDDLKGYLIKVIVVIMVINFFELITENLNNLDFKFLVIPLGVMLIAFSLKLMHNNNKE